MVQSLYFDKENRSPGQLAFRTVATVVCTLLILFGLVRGFVAYGEHLQDRDALAFGQTALEYDGASCSRMQYVGETNRRAQGFLDNSDYVVHEFLTYDLH